MKTVLSVLNELAATSSRNEKIQILRDNHDFAELIQTVDLALNPMIQFYQRKIPAYNSSRYADAAKSDLSWAFGVLMYLANRTVTGNDAIDHLVWILENLSEEDANVVERIIQKDLMCGVAEGIVNKVWRGFIPDYPCMRCSAFDKKLVSKIQFPAFVQTKMDGMRFSATVVDDKAVFLSRNGKPLQLDDAILLHCAFRALSHKIELPEGVVFDGELLVVDDFGKPLDRKTGNGILNKAVKGTISKEEASQVRAVIWDYIPLVEFNEKVWNVPYETRFKTLMNSVVPSAVGHLVALVQTKVVDDEYQAEKSFREAINSGEEGIILKDFRGIWEDKRSTSCVKYKSELDCDLKIVGVEEGAGKYKGMLGALKCQSEDGMLSVDVGSGFDDNDRRQLIKEPLIGRIVAVKYNEKIHNTKGEWSLFLPIFLELREDKTVADKWSDIK